jgi:hypothetical protein
LSIPTLQDQLNHIADELHIHIDLAPQTGNR